MVFRYISAAIASPVASGLCSTGPSITGQKYLTAVAKRIQQAANFSKENGSEIESAANKLILSLSSPPNNLSLNDKDFSNYKDILINKENLTQDFDFVFDAFSSTIDAGQKYLSNGNGQQKKALAVIQHTKQIYIKYKEKLKKHHLLI